jgi:site-specific recombinase XerD
MSALASFYRYAVRQRALTESPFFEVAGPAVSTDSTTTGLSRDELRQLVVTQAHSLRAVALVALLALNGLRITEALSHATSSTSPTTRATACSASSARAAGAAPLPSLPPSRRALDAYIDKRTADPLFTTITGRRFERTGAYRLLRRLARTAKIPATAHISPHSARHAFAALALDAGVALRDVPDAMGHADPRTTRRYDRSRHSLDRHATYAVAAYVTVE